MFKIKGYKCHATDTSKQIQIVAIKVQLLLYHNIYKPSNFWSKDVARIDQTETKRQKLKKKFIHMSHKQHIVLSLEVLTGKVKALL